MEKKVEFKLQNLVLRMDGLSEEYYGMMYRGSRFVYVPMESAFRLNPGDFTEFLTFFNTFSYAQWGKYTYADEIFLRLRCRGDFTVQLFGHDSKGLETKKEFYNLYSFHLKDMTEIEIPVPSCAKGQNIGFQIQVEQKKSDENLPIGSRPGDDCFWIESGYWFTYIPESKIEHINISIVTTTYRKEACIECNVDILERELFYGGEGCNERFRLRIIDTGKTLEPEDYNSKFITLYPNRNTGRAGGCTRGMLESLRDPDFKATHVLLMDDDVLVLAENFLRIYSLLALLKPQYRNYFICGTRMDSGQVNLQYGDVGYMDNDSYAGWQYCCIPVSEINQNRLPAPIFMYGDDVEFSLANRAQLLTMNGICIWHKGGSGRFHTALELYLVHRNSLIIQAMSGICPDIDFIHRIDSFFKENICCLAYENCDVLLDAIEAYNAGPKCLEAPDGDNLMSKYCAKIEKMVDLAMICSCEEGLDAKAVKDSFHKQNNIKQINYLKKLWYDFSYNGHIMPKSLLKKNTAVICCGWQYDPGRQYMCEKVLNVNASDGTGCLRVRSRKRFLSLLRRRRQVMKDYRKNKYQIAKKYRVAGEIFKTEEFWRAYLGIRDI